MKKILALLLIIPFSYIPVYAAKSSEAIAIGYKYQDDQFQPLLSFSHDSGKTWQYSLKLDDILSSKYGKDRWESPQMHCFGKNCFIFKGMPSFLPGSGVVDPFLVVTHDGGNNWSVPESLATKVPNALNAVVLKSVSCSGNLCVAGGSANYEDPDTWDHRKPIIAVSQDGGISWDYPKEIYTDFPKPLVYGLFHDSSCYGKTCVAVGFYWPEQDAGGGQHPLLAVTRDGGLSWFYPKDIDISQDQEFNHVSCSDKACVVVGYGGEKKLYASQDGGKTWAVPPSIHSALPDFIKRFTLHAVKCYENLCMASGLFDDNHLAKPLLAVSHDSGLTWNYPESIYSTHNLPEGFSAGDLSNGITCNPQQCMVIGYFTKYGKSFPLLAVSYDHGESWSYPADIYSTKKLPSKYTFDVDRGFSAISCNGKTCSATAGSYTGTLAGFPLLATTEDGGRTWNYPESIYTSSEKTNYINGFLSGVGMI